MRRGGETARALPVSRLRGNGRFGFAVVGESHRQSELEEIVGGRTEEGAEFECTALLVPELDNAFDQNAIMVFIEAQKIGVLPVANFGKRAPMKDRCLSAQLPPSWRFSTSRAITRRWWWASCCCSR
jgi:hypothetical protein